MAGNIRIALVCVVALIVPAGTASAEIKGDAIRIGVLTDMNGVFATAMGPGSVEAARMAAEEFGGAINGKPIEILQAEEGQYVDGVWKATSILNGDQTDRGLNFRNASPPLVRIRLHTLPLYDEVVHRNAE